MMRPARIVTLACAAIALACALALVPAQALAGDYVLDEANIIPADVEQRIEALSSAIESATPGAQIAVVTVPSLGGRTIEEYAENRFGTLGIGAKDLDNGVLLLVALGERKVRIEVGYGLEGALPDSKAGSIIDSIIIPKFKEGDYAGGIEAGHAAIAGIVAEEYQTFVPGAEVPKSGGWLPSFLVVLAILVALFAVVAYLSIRGVAKAAQHGGVPGALPPIAGPTPSSWSDSHSDDDDSSSSSSSSSSSGGFGGFGGGDSGGGGASGGW
jgi:uncharacterized protein